MFSPFLLSLAIFSNAPGPVIVVDERPTIQIMLANYDLERPGDVKRLKREIRWAADRVCIHGYGLSMYLESVACVKTAVTDANSQLATVLAQYRSGTPLAGAIAVSAHSN
jgi:UrcA family protein